MKKIKKRLLANQLFLITIFSLFSCSIVFIIFQIRPQELFICDEYKEYFISIFNRDLSFIYPINKCDDKVYFAILEDFSLLFENAARPYQNRPLWLLFPYFIYQFMDGFKIFITTDLLYILSYFITQLMFSIFTLNLLLNLLKKYYKLNQFDIFSVTVIFYLNPVIQFFIFTPSNGSLSFMVLVLSLHFLEKGNAEKNSYLAFLITGLLFLLNRSFIICLAVILLFRFKFKIKYFLQSLLGTLVFFIPNYLYKYFITFRGYEPYDINTEMYGHFIWISKYFDEGIFYWLSRVVLSEKNFNLRLTTKWDSDSEWYCQNIPDNFICFFSDMVNVSKYLWLPFFILLTYLFFYTHKEHTSLDRFLITTGFVSIFFWSLIGWYPPLRFSLFSLGNFIFLYLIYLFINLNNFKMKVAILASTTFGLLNINHWNNETILHFSVLNLIAAFILVIYIIEIFKIRKIN